MSVVLKKQLLASIGALHTNIECTYSLDAIRLEIIRASKSIKLNVETNCSIHSTKCNIFVLSCNAKPLCLLDSKVKLIIISRYNMWDVVIGDSFFCHFHGMSKW